MFMKNTTIMIICLAMFCFANTGCYVGFSAHGNYGYGGGGYGYSSGCNNGYRYNQNRSQYGQQGKVFIPYPSDPYDPAQNRVNPNPNAGRTMGPVFIPYQSGNGNNGHRNGGHNNNHRR
jgi:hypothetical protein